MSCSIFLLSWFTQIIAHRSSEHASNLGGNSDIISFSIFLFYPLARIAFLLDARSSLTGADVLLFVHFFSLVCSLCFRFSSLVTPTVIFDSSNLITRHTWSYINLIEHVKCNYSIWSTCFKIFLIPILVISLLFLIGVITSCLHSWHIWLCAVCLVCSRFFYDPCATPQGLSGDIDKLHGNNLILLGQVLPGDTGTFEHGPVLYSFYGISPMCVPPCAVWVMTCAQEAVGTRTGLCMIWGLRL